MQFAIESNQSYSIAHDMFLMITDQIHDWEESESGAMEALSEKYTVNHLVVLFEGDAAKIKDYSKEELRIIRNYIFAKYGYKFKSEDLQEYFSNYDWYDPQYDDVNEKLNEVDKMIVALVRNAEEK